eukprot:g23491.t1
MAFVAQRFARSLAGATALGGAAALAQLAQAPARCDDKDPPHPPRYPFWVKSVFHAHEIPSVRRGYEVYRQAEPKPIWHEKLMEIAASYDVVDGPNDEGEMFTRPGILVDAFPSPYPNEEAARYANGGANPPDLSVYTTAKHEGLDYIFALLLGYRDPPAGIEVRDGLYYNVYFPGGLIGMPNPLHSDGLVDYEETQDHQNPTTTRAEVDETDGTPCTKSQMAKDVVNFLCWAAEPAHDERKLIGLKAASACLVGTFIVGFWYRSMWIGFKTRRIDFTKAVM